MTGTIENLNAHKARLFDMIRNRDSLIKQTDALSKEIEIQVSALAKSEESDQPILADQLPSS